MAIQKLLSTGMKPHDIYARIHKATVKSFLLESAEKDGELARYSFIGFNPEKTFSYRGRTARFNGYKAQTEDPMGEMKRILDKEKAGGSVPGFIGGFVGYVSYDFVRTLERIGSKNRPSGFPLLEFGLFHDGLRVNNNTGEVFYVSTGAVDRRGEVERMLAGDASHAPLSLGTRSCSFSQKAFEAAVRRAKRHINAGDIFQAVISKRYEIEFSGELLDFYLRLKQINPSPYMYYLDFDRRQIIGSSPENLIRVENGRIDSFATLAGTRPRGATRQEDRRLERELLADPKECAEHRMLVDLTRNDVGRVAETGSVSVPELMVVRKFSHVQHISSHVTAHLRDGLTAFDALKAILPAGTLSGAPKIRAMQIIEGLEPVSRGPYGGAVGYFGFNGNADFGICIRSVVAGAGRLYVQSGAGIVADSVPEKEYLETEAKVMAMMKSLEAVAAK